MTNSSGSMNPAPDVVDSVDTVLDGLYECGTCRWDVALLLAVVERVAQRSCACMGDVNPVRIAQRVMSLILYGLGKTEVFQEDGGPVLQKDREQEKAFMQTPETGYGWV